MVDSAVEAADIARMQLVSFARGYRVPHTVFLAHRVGLFERLPAEGIRADALARALALPERNLGHLLGALVALGILACERGRYRLADAFDDLLSPKSEAFIGPILESAFDENLHWSRNAREVLQGRYHGAPYAGEFLNRETVHQNLRNVEASNRQAICLVWPLIRAELEGVSSILDLGGGPAYDLVVINELLELFPTEDKARILDGAVRALAHNGQVLIVKFSLDDAGITPPAAAFFSLRMRLKYGSYLETDAETVELLHRSGCAPPLVRRVGPLKTVFISQTR